MIIHLLLLFLTGVKSSEGGSCSYDDSTLVNWDAAWAKAPAEDEYAVISKGQHVRLNISPPKLKGITIEDGASLVWGDYDGLVITTDYIHISGKFIIGDEGCPFTKKANIKLTGKSNTDNIVNSFGRKVIGVDVSGTLELHGEVKKSWSKLIQTMPAAKDTCGTVFSFKDSVFGNEMAQGLYVMAFNLDGTVFDLNIFKTTDENNEEAEDEFKSFVKGIPNDKYMMIVVNGDLGSKTAKRDWEKIYSTVETVGGVNSTLLRNVGKEEPYAFIMRTGQTSSTKEAYAPSDNKQDSISTKKLILFDEAKNLQYSVVATVASRGSRGVDIKVLSGDVAYPTIKLNDDVSTWKTGDTIIVASTDYDWRQVEEFKVLDCKICAANEVKLDHPFEYLHYGDVTYGVEQTAEVGLLTRSILIEGILEDECYKNDAKDRDLCDKFNMDTHGGHVKVNRGFEAVHVENVELYHMGQQKFLGSYSLHFHMCDDVNGNWFRHNSIHHILTRCVTIHGTDRAEVSDNVCYLTKGHSIFLEDSVEQWNIIDGNLVIGTEHGSILLSDSKREWAPKGQEIYTDALSSFWITHPNNYVRNNAAAGSDNTGFWHLSSYRPLGLSAERQKERGLVGYKHAFYSKLLQFDDNVAHSCSGRGWRFDSRIVNEGEVVEDGVTIDENGVMTAETSHVARDPPNENGTLVTSIARRLVTYKNKNQNVWTKAGNLIMDRFSSSDGLIGVSMARAELLTYSEVTNSLFIGESENVGKPKEPWGRSYPGSADHSIQGAVFYQGPAFVTNCLFDKFQHLYDGSTFRPAGAISFKRDTPYPSAPNNGVRDIKFGFCDGTDTNWVFQGNATLNGFANKDGNRQASFRDYDGSVTGEANTQVVQNNRFFTTNRCSVRESWGVSICPYEYARAIFEGKSGTFKDNNDNYAMYMRRDDRPDDPFALKGERRDNYLLMKNMSYTAYFNGTTPDDVTVTAENLETGDYIRVGLCFSKDSTFTFRSDYPLINNKNPITQLHTIEALDADNSGKAYFFDNSTGLLFLKFVGFSQELNKEKCPGGKCLILKITRTGGKTGEYDCYKDAYGDGKYTKKEDTTSPIPAKPKCNISKDYKSYGVPIKETNYPTEKFEPTCPEEPTYPEYVKKGCYKDVSSYRDLPYAGVENYQSMTVTFCVKRCYQREYPYAAMENGYRCFCGNFYGAYEETPDDCTKPCPGDDTQMCGGSKSISVYSTGRDTLPDLPTCGTGNTGAKINNKCYYLTSEKGTYVNAQRSCVRMGGNLATITSEDIQNDLVQYMRPKKVDAWFGLNDVTTEGTLEYVDGTAVGTYDNTKEGQINTQSKDAYVLAADSLYTWNYRGTDESHQALCELDLNAVAPSGVTCGKGDLGKKFGDGACYALIDTTAKYEDAKYVCYTRKGSLVEVNDQNKNEILQHLYVYGESIDYWTGEEDSKGNPIALTYENLYGKTATNAGNEKGVICLLETEKACSAAWKEHSGQCYLYTETQAGSYDEAEGLCKQGFSNIVTIPNEGVNTFVAGMVNEVKSSSFFIGFKYEGGTFKWVDGSSSSYTNWKPKEGDDNTKKGKCARMNASDGKWKNRKCTANGFVVCQMTAGQ